MFPVSMMQQNSRQTGIVQSGLITWYDPTNPECYPGGGVEMYDLSAKNTNGFFEPECEIDGNMFRIRPGGYFWADWLEYGLKDLTISFWWLHKSDNLYQYPVLIHSNPDDHIAFDVNDPDYGHSHRGMWVYWNGFRVNYSAISAPPDGGSQFVDGALRQYTFRRKLADAQKSRHYIDGIEVTTNIQTAGNHNLSIVNTEPAYLYLGGNDFDGKIGEVLIYNRALSDAEILQNYNTSAGKFY